MPTYTSTYALAKPLVGGEPTSWGDNGWTTPADTAIGLNDNMAIIDYHMFSRKTGGDITGPVTFKQATAFEQDVVIDAALHIAEGNANIDRSGEGVAAFLNVRADSGFARGVRIARDGGTYENAAIVDDAGNLQFGDAAHPVVEYVANATGRHNFYCGTGQLDAALNSDGFYLFGATGFATTGPVLAQGAIDPTTLAVSGGMLMSYESGAGFIANASGGQLQFRIGGTASGWTKAYIETNGYLFASSHQSGGVKLGRGASHINFDNVGDLGDFQFTFAGATRAKVLNDGGAEFKDVKITTNGTASDPAIDFNGLTRLYNDTSFRLSVAKGDNTKIATFDDIGATLNADVSVVTREKGDARYVQSATNLAILGFARVNSNGSLARSGGIVASSVRNGTGSYTVTYSVARNNAVTFVTPILSSNRTTAIITAQDNTSITFRMETGSGTAVDAAFNFMVM